MNFNIRCRFFAHRPDKGILQDYCAFCKQRNHFRVVAFYPYRVLLTRARSGMVICVPEGNPNKNPSGFWEDSTRLPEYYNGTYQYLKNIGIEEI